MADKTMGDLGLWIPRMNDSIDGPNGTIEKHLPENFQKIDEEFTAHKADYTSAHGGTYHKNLLHNWDFRKPVNQRGLTSYSNVMYTIDRWLWTVAVATRSITINSGYITIENTSGTTGVFAQKLGALEPGTYTLSVQFSDNTVESRTLTWDGSTLTEQATSFGALSLRLVDGFPTFAIGIGAGKSINVKAVKLEKGNVSTLANDPNADFGEQLALCQRYQLSLISDLVPATVVGTNSIFFLIPTPVQMRIMPSIAINDFKIKDINGVEQAGFNIIVSSVRSNGIIMRAEKTSHGLTNASINAGTLSLLDANL